MELKAGYKLTDAGVIPFDWDLVNLGDKSSKVGSGITPTGGERVYKAEGRPFLRSQNIGWGCLLMDDIAFIDNETHESFNSTEIEQGDVFLNITGASIGRSAVADERVVGGNVNQHVCIIRPNHEKLNYRFLNYFLLSRNGQRQIDSFQAGGNRQGLNFGQIRSFLLPLPPVPEQRAIAAALGDVDALIAALDRLIAKKRDIKQAVMQELLTGRRRLPGYDGEWRTCRLGEVIRDCSSGATPYRGRSDYYAGKVKWITSGELNYNLIMDTIEHISSEAVRDTNLKVHPVGTFLMAITGLEAAGTRGACGIVGSPATTNQSCMAIYPKSDLKTNFLYHYYYSRA